VSSCQTKLCVESYFAADPNIRHTVLSTLDTRFDRHLAQAENVRSLFIALNDEVFANREVAIGIIGRLGEWFLRLGKMWADG
jgi:FKBP12-rapamycin complex-associated protein